MTNRAKFVSLIEAHQGLINKVVFLYADRQEERRDLKQEIISQAWGAFGTFEGRAKFSTWLYRVSLNVAMVSLRRLKKVHELEKSVHVDVAEPDGDPNELLEAILQVLNPIEKSIVLLLVEGFSQQEIAEMLGISDGNTRIKIHRIRKKLSDYGIDKLA